ncbi:MAG: 1,4-beta-xylanase, partial [Lachnospiraceae bacterium]|nr:1,4-beta-xylanase [Lachnospiraceae bacterium]
GYSNNNNNNNNSGSWNGITIECENMTKAGQNTGNINNPFNGVALYENNDSVSFTQYFAYEQQNFSLKACSNNSNMARVDLYIANEYKGTFYYGGSYPATYTIENVRHGLGNLEVKLVVTADDGNWDAYLDNLTIK